MSTTVNWSSEEYDSIETCVITHNIENMSIFSAIHGVCKSNNFQVAYDLVLSLQWKIISGTISARYQENQLEYSFRKDGETNWFINGRTDKQFEGCEYIDISLTPFTNSLPINALNLDINAAEEIEVIYFDMLAGKVKAVRQRYTKLTGSTYKFENIPNDFEAVITVDDLGLVVDYPGLFMRRLPG